jgi:hypothetical protein
MDATHSPFESHMLNLNGHLKSAYSTPSNQTQASGSSHFMTAKSARLQ